jgi:ADP-heptose:LPS heptosyltransferase
MRRVEQGEPTFLPVFLTGGIGDAILSIPTLRKLKEEGHEILIYSDHADAVRYFYKDQPILKGQPPEFTWCLHLDSVAKFKFTERFGGFLLDSHRLLFDGQQALFKDIPVLETLVQRHPSHKYLLTSLASDLGLTASEFPIFSLGLGREVGGDDIPRKEPAGNYITIHDGFDLNNSHAVSDRATKTWRLEGWNELVRLIRHSYPEMGIIQVGSKTSRIISGTTKSLVNQTTLPEVFDTISRAKIHIDADSGLVHAATTMGVPCVTMFGPTPDSFYGHKQNVNISSRESCSGGCFHLTENWMDKCPLGYKSPKCMDDIDAAVVMDAVVGLLK